MKKLKWMPAVVIAGLLLVPASAAASTCGEGSGSTFALYDATGGSFDFTDNFTANPATADDPFAALDDGFTRDSLATPPGPADSVQRDDAYDDWGGLFVGGTDAGHLYNSPDGGSCSLEDGTEQVFPVVPLDGLQVQRKVFVSPTGLPGARILDELTNPGSAPVTTTVQVGDLNSGDGQDDLGSDADTGVRASSSGDLAVDASDDWAITSDNPIADEDPALLHIADGQGGAVKANLFQVGGGNDTTPEDNLAYGWTVTVPPQATVSLMSFEVMTAVTGRATSDEVAKLTGFANQYEAHPPAIFSGMTPAEVASVRNWPVPGSTTPPPTRKKCKKAKKPKKKTAAAAKKKHKKCGKKRKHHKKK